MSHTMVYPIHRRSASAPPPVTRRVKNTKTNPSAVASANLKTENRKLIPVIKDGNSFFRSVSYLFSGHERNYIKWRKVIIAFESLFPDHVFHTDMIDKAVRYEHAQKLSINRAPATEFELIAFATMVQCQVYVYDMISTKPYRFVWRLYLPRFACEQLYNKGYLTFYRERNIYSPIKDNLQVSTDEQEQARHHRWRSVY
ncbi:uncharacterized protein LOC106873271 [Octopus bimaculoides]|uniref:Uncharacterized protein n=1 Tax=Octopus bimaculoides TaxID=37653 RepID=A0A0L8H2I2_OCTBM|nr:uncharacterized protein LOC106873271 [Octopus bimaculoides]|eukprot:XP_014776050.1 PREDICTED: uncharacterized protein LOC106873271 [Octopus bimaculoides]